MHYFNVFAGKFHCLMVNVGVWWAAAVWWCFMNNTVLFDALLKVNGALRCFIKNVICNDCCSWTRNWWRFFLVFDAVCWCFMNNTVFWHTVGLENVDIGLKHEYHWTIWELVGEWWGTWAFDGGFLLGVWWCYLVFYENPKCCVLLWVFFMTLLAVDGILRCLLASVCDGEHWIRASYIVLHLYWESKRFTTVSEINELKWRAL